MARKRSKKRKGTSIRPPSGSMPPSSRASEPASSGAPSVAPESVGEPPGSAEPPSAGTNELAAQDRNRDSSTEKREASRSSTPPEADKKAAPADKPRAAGKGGRASFFDIDKEHPPESRRPPAVQETSKRDSQSDAGPHAADEPESAEREVAAPGADADVRSEASAKDEGAEQPPAGAPDEPREAKEQQPGAHPGKDQAAEGQQGASPKKPPKSKRESKRKARDDERESEAKDSGAHDDALHDDFFRKGEEVEKEHIAALERAVNGERPLDDTGAIRLAKVRTDPKLIERRKKLRRVVAYILAPATIIAFIAAAKLINGNGEASPAGSISADPPIATIALPSASARVEPMPSAATSDDAAGPIEGADAESDAAIPDAADAAANAEDAPSAQDAAAAVEGAVAAEDAGAAPSVPDGVDSKKEAQKALNLGKWEQAIAMSQAAIARDPEDAAPYLFQGTALQELGRRDEAKAVFKRCTEVAKRGSINECRMFAGH